MPLVLHALVYVCVYMLCLDVYLVLCSFITHVDLCDHNHNQDTEQFQYLKELTYCSFITAATSFLSPFSMSGNKKYIYVLHLYNFFISRMLYEWTHLVYNLLRLAFSLSIILWRVICGILCIKSLVLFQNFFTTE